MILVSMGINKLIICVTCADTHWSFYNVWSWYNLQGYAKIAIYKRCSTDFNCHCQKVHIAANNSAKHFILLAAVESVALSMGHFNAGVEQHLSTRHWLIYITDSCAPLMFGMIIHIIFVSYSYCPFTWSHWLKDKKSISTYHIRVKTWYMYIVSFNLPGTVVVTKEILIS